MVPAFEFCLCDLLYRVLQLTRCHCSRSGASFYILILTITLGEVHKARRLRTFSVVLSRLRRREKVKPEIKIGNREESDR